ncbi:hypothetical protein AZ23_1866, partial [Bordetella bronchiseptica E010]
MGVADLSKADATQSEADLLIYGLPTDPDLAVGALSEIQSVLSPKRILLLSDIMPLPIPMQALPVNAVCGCLPKTAPVEVLEAAIRLVMAGGQCFPGEQALQPAIAAGYPSAMRVTNDGVKPTMPISTGAQLLQITPRQYEVLVLLARGYPISPSWVKPLTVMRVRSRESAFFSSASTVSRWSGSSMSMKSRITMPP